MCTTHTQGGEEGNETKWGKEEPGKTKRGRVKREKNDKWDLSLERRAASAHSGEGRRNTDAAEQKRGGENRGGKNTEAVQLDEGIFGPHF